MILIISFCAVVSIWVGLTISAALGSDFEGAVAHALFCFGSMKLASFIWNW